MMATTALTQRATVHEMCVVYHEARDKIRAAHKMLQEAKSQLDTVFLASTCYSFNVNPERMSYRSMEEKMEMIETGLKKSAWKIITERLEIRRFMSTKDAEKLDKQLEDSKAMPELKEEAIMSFLADVCGRVGQFQDEAIRECFDMLRPRHIGHVTNERNAKYALGRKIILTGWVSRAWGGGGYSPNHYRDHDFRILQNTFNLLDGKGAINTYYGELADSIIETTQPVEKDGVRSVCTEGETGYFRWKVYQNGNLHLEFKRMDLVQRLNEIGGAGKLCN